MRVWITGGAGFVGQRLAARLRSDGCEVDGADHELDVTSLDLVRTFLRERGADAIVHLAGISFVPAADRDPLLAWRVNYVGTRTILEAVRREAPTTRVVTIASGMIYGTQAPEAPPFEESAPLRPEGPYAVTKAAADLLAGQYAKNGLDVARVRPFNHTGAGRPPHFVESSFARQLAQMERGEAEPVLRVGNLASVRDFLHVDDVVDAYARLARPGGPKGVFNVASGRPARIQELLNLLVARASVEPRVEVDPALHRETDANTGDARRLREATGWAPRHALEAVLEELLEDWRKRLAAA